MTDQTLLSIEELKAKANTKGRFRKAAQRALTAVERNRRSLTSPDIKVYMQDSAIVVQAFSPDLEDPAIDSFKI